MRVHDTREHQFIRQPTHAKRTRGVNQTSLTLSQYEAENALCKDMETYRKECPLEMSSVSFIV